ncbi:sugar-binding domain-containing protein [Streptomyces sp. NPDC059544]|uniref:sugar-binding domain-containing protein n=1 Tax=Streptomyces sp. NPDC059544 TaxID=3346861 RepID=UPI0036B52068
MIADADGLTVGIGKGSRPVSDLDVTDLVRPGGTPTLWLTVVNWSDASHIEDQDQRWRGGITRSVRLCSTDRPYLDDVAVRAGRTAACASAAGSAERSARGWSVSAGPEGRGAAGTGCRCRLRE